MVVTAPPGGAAAAGMGDEVRGEVKGGGFQPWATLVRENAARRNAALVGTVQEVLVEGPSRTDPAVLRGRTRTNKTTLFAGDAAEGELAMVRIDRSTSQTLAGRQAVAAVA